MRSHPDPMLSIRPLQWGKTLWGWMTNTAFNPETELGYLSRLLSGLLLMVIATGVVGHAEWLIRRGEVNFSALPPIAAILLLGVVYVVNRRGYYRTAVILTIGVMVFGLYTIFWLGNRDRAAVELLVYMVVPILMAEFFLSPRAYAVVALLSLSGMLGSLHLSGVPDTLIFLGGFSALLGVSTQHRRKLEQKRQWRLEEAERKYRTLVEEVPAITYAREASRAGMTLYVSPQIEPILGLSPEQWKGVYIPSWLDLIHPNDRTGVGTRFDLLVETGQPFDVEYRVSTQDGRLVWIHDQAVMLRDDADNTASIQGVMYDVTDRKQAEQRFLESEELFRTAFEFSPVGMCITALDGRLQNVNQSLADMLGFPKDGLKGKHFNDITHPDDLEIGRDALKQMLAGVVRSISFEKRYMKKSGEAIWAHVSTTLLRDLSGQPLHFITHILNVTQRRQVEEELRTLNDDLERRVTERTELLNQTNIELEHANRAKDEFLANMSHELRTPLNSILGLSETLLEQRGGSLNERQQRSLQIIESSGHHLLELINDILDLSKIEAGKFDYYPEPVPLDDLCRSSLAFIKTQAAKKSITVTYANQASISQILADSRRLKQILVNLLTNAVKFTPEKGEVRLHVITRPEEGLLQFSVIDTGIGIATEDIQRLFQPFVQMESSLNRHHEGTGLGLALVQKLTDLHGGSVHVESEVGKGSRFTIHLPWRQEAITQPVSLKPTEESLAAASSLTAEETVGHSVVLLAEDNLANILTIGEYIERHGFEVVVAHDGWEALAKAEETDPDIILMDIQMPALDGLEATRHLRENPRFASTPIIALTALAMPGDRERCLAAGATEYMSKPVRLKTLVETINKLLGQEQ